MGLDYIDVDSIGGTGCHSASSCCMPERLTLAADVEGIIIQLQGSSSSEPNAARQNAQCGNLI